MPASFSHRRSVRLRGYDYAQAGAYFVTVCAYRRAHLFGTVAAEAVVLSDLGRCVFAEWRATIARRGLVRCEAFVVMPNHVHALVTLLGTETGSSAPDASICGPRRASVSAVVGGFKSAVTRRYRRHIGAPDARVWQRGFHEHVVRHPRAFARIQQYIAENPRRWVDDRYNARR